MIAPEIARLARVLGAPAHGFALIGEARLARDHKEHVKAAQHSGGRPSEFSGTSRTRAADTPPLQKKGDTKAKFCVACFEGGRYHDPYPETRLAVAMNARFEEIITTRDRLRELNKMPSHRVSNNQTKFADAS